jgi:hypothetical protein
MEKVNLKFRVTRRSIFLIRTILYPLEFLNKVTFNKFADPLCNLSLKVADLLLEVKEVK